MTTLIHDTHIKYFKSKTYLSSYNSRAKIVKKLHNFILIPNISIKTTIWSLNFT